MTASACGSEKCGSSRDWVCRVNEICWELSLSFIQILTLPLEPAKQKKFKSAPMLSAQAKWSVMCVEKEHIYIQRMLKGIHELQLFKTFFLKKQESSLRS